MRFYTIYAKNTPENVNGGCFCGMCYCSGYALKGFLSAHQWCKGAVGGIGSGNAAQAGNVLWATGGNKNRLRMIFGKQLWFWQEFCWYLHFWQHLDNARCNNTNPHVTENVRSCHNKNPLNIFAYIIIVLIILACEILLTAYCKKCTIFLPQHANRNFLGFSRA